MGTAPDAFGRIVVHELGHAVHARADAGVLGQVEKLFLTARHSRRVTSVYAARNAWESFAESFAAYFVEPDDLRRTDPDAYALVRAIPSSRGIHHDPSRDTPTSEL